MKNSLIIIYFLAFGLTYAQNKKCTISDLQIDTYEFTISNLTEINQNISDKNSLIEVTIEIENKKIKQINYNLILPENSYSGENKSEIQPWKGLSNFIIKNINYKLKNCPDFGNYDHMVYRIPLSKENIEKAFDEVNQNIIQTKKI